MRSACSLFLIMLVPLCSGCYRSAVLHGQVIDSKTKEPIAGALVESFSYVERADLKDMAHDFSKGTPDARRRCDRRGFFSIKYKTPFIYMGHFEGQVVPGIRIQADGHECLHTGGSKIWQLPTYPDKTKRVYRFSLDPSDSAEVKAAQSHPSP